MASSGKPRRMRRVRSAALRAVEYDSEHPWLEVQLYHGAVYRYLGVPAEVYQELLAATSKGKFFRENIQDRYLVLRGQE